ncbi:hypothetical protein D9M69_569170 [compost metagenome]
MFACCRHAKACFTMIGEAAFVRGKAAIDDIDDGGFARAIMADKSDAFAFMDYKLSAIKCLYRTELHANIACSDNLAFVD